MVKIGKKLHLHILLLQNKGTNDAFYDDIFEKGWRICATTWQEFLDISMALGMQLAPKGDNIVMITNGGGSGLLSCDHFERRGMPMHELAEISPNLAGESVNICQCLVLRLILLIFPEQLHLFSIKVHSHR